MRRHALPPLQRRPRRRAPRRGWRGVVDLLRLLWLALALLASPAMAQPRSLDQALVVASDLAQFPQDLPAQTRSLPDEWADWRADGADGPVWYRLRFDATPPDTLMAVSIARACSSYELHLNGQLLQRAGRQTDPAAQRCNHPQLVTLPAALLLPEGNMLDLRLSGQPLARVVSREHAGGLSAVLLAPQAQLTQAHALATLTEVDLPQAISATLALMGSFMFVLGWRHRQHSHLAYFGALSVLWALLETRRWLPELALRAAALEFLLCALLAFVTLAAVQFLLRYARWRGVRVGRLLAMQCALMPATLVLGGPDKLHMLATAWSLVFAFQIAGAALFHLHLRRRLRGALPWPALALLSGVGLALAVDLLGQRIALPPGWLPLARLVVPLALVLTGLRLVQQHGQALHASEASRAQLETRVREASEEIERNFRQLSELRVEQVTERERKRIAADLHDDLGAKLLTIVHTSDDPRISTLAREALEEMRLSVRGLTGKPVRLGDALGDWRAELMSRLGQSGIEGEWTSPDELPHTLSARAYVQTTRILREATSNIIKHSRASRCAIECLVNDDDLLLTIQDNGQGIPLELDGRLDRGHGMSSMKQRAKQLQGQCLVESGPGYGTVIRLTLPLDHATQPAP